MHHTEKLAFYKLLHLTSYYIVMPQRKIPARDRVM